VPVPPKPDGPSVRSGYDRWSEIYDVESNPLIGLEEPVVREALGDVAGLAVLDLGCGTGRHALWLAGAGATVTAVDFSERMMEKARAKPGAEKIRFLVHDLHAKLPFADGAFDLVVSGLVLEHLRDFGVFFGEARRVLKPGGHAVVSGMHPAMFLLDVRARFHDPATGEKVEPGSVEHEIGDVVMAAVRAGFSLEGIVERAPDAAFAARCPRAERYVGWPMLLVLQLRA
jgi:malonyl-CoA O-methyltransferase